MRKASAIPRIVKPNLMSQRAKESSLRKTNTKCDLLREVVGKPSGGGSVTFTPLRTPYKELCLVARKEKEEPKGCP